MELIWTVAIVERKNWLGADNEILDKEKVIKRLNDYEIFLDRCLENNWQYDYQINQLLRFDDVAFSR